VAIVFLSLVVWGHHMFTVGMGHPLDIVFSVGSFLIAIATGTKVFNWTATTWGGSMRYTPATLFALAFAVQFAIGGVTGVTGVVFAALLMDWQMEDTYFVVAHLHYGLLGGSAFALWTAIY
jgi:heme/copper-type cytochrome/quinol oxidase subunit 1